MNSSRWLVLLFALLWLAACGGSGSPPFATPVSNQVPVHQHTPSAEHAHVDPWQASDDMQVALVPSELIVGWNRLAVGLLDAKGQAIRNAVVHFHYYDLSSTNNPVLESEADAVNRRSPDGFTTIFAHEREFRRSGEWGVEVQARLPDGKTAIKRIGFKVLQSSSTVKVGQKAPVVETPTLASGKNELSKLTSAAKPVSAFYELSLDKALASGKPTVLLFATPAFCQTRFCGPMYEVSGELHRRYGGKANFIHVEVFTGLPNPAENNWQTAPAMQAFGLRTEPWLFIIRRDGVIAYRVEGLFTADEVESHLQVALNR